MSATPPRVHCCLGALIVLLAVLAGGLAPSGSSAATPRFSLGLGDFLFRSPDPLVGNRWLDRADNAGAEVIRINVHWRGAAPGPRPADPADPADPAYDFTVFDQAVTGAVARGLRPLLTVYSAPTWAEGEDRPHWADRGSWKPDASELQLFARALARRYSGNFAGLPRVRHYQVWNEPNLALFLAPQRSGKKMVGPEIYRKLLNSFYVGIHSVHADNMVLTGGTAPYGDPTSDRRSPPVMFLRRLLCLKDGKRLLAARCPVRARFDILAHHPINTSGGPGRSALSPDDASSPNLGRIVRVLRAAERQRTVLPRKRRPVWATEFWWKSNPPDTQHGVSLAKQARWFSDSVNRYWRAGARVAIYMLLQDSRPNRSGPPGQWATGLYFLNGPAKPALRAFRFPFVVRRVTARRTVAWGLPPRSGVVRIEMRRAGKWKRVARARVSVGRPFNLRLAPRSIRRGRKFRAKVQGYQSLPWLFG